MLLLLTTAELKLSKIFKLMFLETIKVCKWLVFINSVTNVFGIATAVGTHFGDNVVVKSQ